MYVQQDLTVCSQGPDELQLGVVAFQQGAVYQARPINVEDVAHVGQQDRGWTALRTAQGQIATANFHHKVMLPRPPASME